MADQSQTTTAAAYARSPAAPQLIAPLWHTGISLAFFAMLAGLGWLVSGAKQGPRTPSPRLVPIQIEAIVFEWSTVLWVWFGLRRKRVRLRELIGGRWPNARAVLLDLALAAGLWGLWLGIAKLEVLLIRDGIDYIPVPKNLIEGLLAIAVAISAGFSEEIVFRGYFQRQFSALTRSAVAAVILQAAVFAVPHIYQGVRIVAEAAILGVLFGVLVYWRGSLRPGMIAHAWSDIAARLMHI